jgi:hypothetical protein
MAVPKVFAYPRESVVAEKLEAIVNLGMANSRMKDYFDLWFIATTYQDDPAILARAIRRTFQQRGQPMPASLPDGLSDEFVRDAAKQSQWSAFIRKAIGSSVTLEEVVGVIRDFAMPLFRSAI